MGDLAGLGQAPLEETVVLDELEPAWAARIAISEGREAAMPFHPEIKPIDAYNAAIIDRLEYQCDWLKGGRSDETWSPKMELGK